MTGQWEEQDQREQLETHGPSQTTRFAAVGAVGQEEVKRSLFYDEDETAESEYMPSASSSSSSSEEDEADEESDGEIVSTEELMQDDERPAVDDGEDVEFEPQDKRYWKSIREKKAWIAQFKEADRRYVKQFGARLATSGDPKAKTKLRREKQWQPIYRLVLILLVVAYLVTILYRKKPPTPSLLWSNGTNVQRLEHQAPVASELASTASKTAPRTASASDQLQMPGSSDDASAKSLKVQVELWNDGSISASSVLSDVDYVQTGLDLCSKLLYRLVDASHDADVKRLASQACDAVVVLAPRDSLQSVKAHVLRGDLLSLESDFDAAERDYEAAEATMTLLSQPVLTERVQHKRRVNRWTHLYTMKKFGHLQKECHEAVHASATETPERQLAEHWIQVFERKKKLLDVLTELRLVTLQRLVLD